MNSGELNYNEAFALLYARDKSPLARSWAEVGAWQKADMGACAEQQRLNESTASRAVGLVVETRPDRIDAQALVELRKLGCTKVQIGVQTPDADILLANGRRIDEDCHKRAFEYLRLFGFKIHAHAMLNLYRSDPARDLATYETLMTDQAFIPDEVKLYPCMLIAGTQLERLFDAGTWVPYDEETLLELLGRCMLATPPYTRVSRMIRDFSASDIVAGSRKANMRQLVEERIAARGKRLDEIRFREVSGAEVDFDSLELKEIEYATSVTDEIFLQWVTPTGSLAGFCRLSLPHQDAVRARAGELPISCGEAMIREVHVYGRVAKLNRSDANAQHRGLGRALVERACACAKERGFAKVNVISAVGTRGYYRKLGFADGALYQFIEL